MRAQDRLNKRNDVINTLQNYNSLQYPRLFFLSFFLLACDALSGRTPSRNHMHVLLIPVLAIPLNLFPQGSWQEQRREYLRRPLNRTIFQNRITRALWQNMLILAAEALQIYFLNKSFELQNNVFFVILPLILLIMMSRKLKPLPFVAKIHIANEIMLAISTLILVRNTPLTYAFQIPLAAFHLSSYYFYRRLMNNYLLKEQNPEARPVPPQELAAAAAA